MLRMRSFASQYVLLVTLVITKYSNFIDENSRRQWIEYCLSDSKFCSNSFGASERCYALFDDIEFIEDLGSAINSMFGSRTIQMGRIIGTGQPIVIKHVTDTDKINMLKRRICDRKINFEPTTMISDEDMEHLEHFGRSSERIDGIQKCRNGITPNFIKTLNHFHSPAVFLAQLFINPELVLLKALNNDQRFDRIVPKLYDSNGFVLIESFDGKSLHEFYANKFWDRLQLAKNLLHAAQQFSIGINGLR